MSRIASGVTAAVVVIALVVPATPAPANAPSTGLTAPASAASRDFFWASGARDAVFMDFVVGPQALGVDGRTLVAFQGASLDPYVTSFDARSGSWSGPYRAGDNALSTDTHGAPAIWRDASGYLHVIYGAHGAALRQSRTRRPNDITSWVDESRPGAPAGTYPRILSLPGGRVGLFYRSEDTGARDWSLRISSDGGRTWGPPRKVLDSVGDQAWYASARATADGSVLIAFVRQDYDRFYRLKRWSRFDVHWLRIAPDGTARNAAGAVVSLPLTWSTAATRCLAIKTSDYANHSIPTLDTSGTPGALYLRGSGAGPSNYRWCFARYEAGRWIEREICRTDHYYDTASLMQTGDRLDAALVTGGSSGRGRGDWDHTDRGGDIVHFTSDDSGVSWARVATVSPTTPATLYNQPIYAQGTAEPQLLFAEWANRPSIDAHALYLADADGLHGRSFAATQRRIASADRFATSVAVSRVAFPAGSPVAFLVNADSPADALTAGALAAKAGGPILLVRASGAPASVRAELLRLRAGEIIAVGGERSVPATVLAAAKTKWTTKTTRLGGADRYETAAVIAARLRATDGVRSRTAVVVDGVSLADGLAAAPLADTLQGPVLLTDRTRVPAATRAALSSWGTTETIVLGGPSSVPDVVVRALPGGRRLGGRDRTQVAAAAARLALERGSLGRRAVLVNGWSMSDGLTAGVLAARLRAPLLLTGPAYLSPAAASALTDSRGALIDVWSVGGDATLSPRVRSEISAAIAP